MQKANERMMVPDLLKILATVLVVIIHHKQNTSDYFMSRWYLFHGVLLCIYVAIGIFLYVRESKKGIGVVKSLIKAIQPILLGVAFYFLRKFPVAMFLIISSYFLAGSITRYDKSIGDWYKASNLIPRIARFYVPFLPLFILGLLYKIFVLHYDYTVLEVIVRFFLGGFKPGSYYITILAELILFFPIVYVVVRRYKFTGVVFCTLITLIYDVLCVWLGMGPVAYKFIIFRFTAHIAFGIYGKISDLDYKSIKIKTTFLVGFLYALFVVYLNKIHLPIFYQWQEASFPTAMYIYPVIAFLMVTYRNLSYKDTFVSRAISTVSGATYHIFMVQLIYYTTFGFALNEYINDFMISMPLNLIVTFSFGVLYYKAFSPVENKILSKTQYIFKKTRSFYDMHPKS